MKNKKRREEKKLNVAAILEGGILGIVIGIVLLLFPSENETLKSTLVTIGQLLISIAFGSMLLEWFGYVKYTQQRMCEILCEDEVLNVLSTKRKRELKTAILNNLYMPNKNLGENNIVSTIDNEMDNILKDYCYKEYIMYVDIDIATIDGREYIKKTIRKTYCAETINNKSCDLESILETQIDPVRGNDTVVLKELLINGEKQVGIDIKMDNNEGEPSNHYEKVFYADVSEIKDKLKFSDTISIDMTYETYTNLEDKVFSHQINKPCEHYCIHFNYANNITMDVVGFGFMTNGNDEKMRIVKTINGHMLRFMSWILPGDGVMAALTIKE